MVREQSGIQLSRSFNFKRIFEIPGRQAQGLNSEETNCGIGNPIEEKQYKSEGATPAAIEPIGSVFDRSSEKGPISRLSKEGGGGTTPQSMDRQTSGTHSGSWWSIVFALAFQWRDHEHSLFSYRFYFCPNEFKCFYFH